MVYSQIPYRLHRLTAIIMSFSEVLFYNGIGRSKKRYYFPYSYDHTLVGPCYWLVMMTTSCVCNALCFKRVKLDFPTFSYFRFSSIFHFWKVRTQNILPIDQLFWYKCKVTFIYSPVGRGTCKRLHVNHILLYQNHLHDENGNILHEILCEGCIVFPKDLRKSLSTAWMLRMGVQSYPNLNKQW